MVLAVHEHDITYIVFSVCFPNFEMGLNPSALASNKMTEPNREYSNLCRSYWYQHLHG
jgi:hypothetical protein